MPSQLARLLSLIAISLCVAGCATRLQVPAQGESAAKLVALQNPLLTPKNGGRLVSGVELKPGDIILSSANGLTSVGIRLLTLAPVSHASLYLGGGTIAEAIGEGVRLRGLDQVLNEEAVVVAFRHPTLDEPHASALAQFALQQVGARYNHVGVILHAPFSLERRICELPLVPEAVRDFCVRGVAAVQLGAVSNDRFFCSQFVLEAYRFAGLPITDTDPRFISPADILHMREGDVPSVRIRQSLTYVGHLKFNLAADAMPPLSAR